MLADQTSNTQHKEPWLAVLLSYLYPGLGQIYAGRAARGVMLAAAQSLLVIGAFLLLLSPTGSVLIGLSVAPLAVLLQIFNWIDAHRSARQTNSPAFEQARKRQRDPWLAVMASFLLPSIGHFYLRRWLLALGFLFAVVVLWVLEPPGSVVWQALLLGIACLHSYQLAPRREQTKAEVAAIVIGLAGYSFIWDSGLAYFRGNIVRAVKLPTESMLPTLVPGDHAFLRITSKVKRGDLVAFVGPGEGRIPMVKRLAAVGRETISIKGGVLFIDGQPLNQAPFDRFRYSPPDDTPEVDWSFEVPAGQVFVLGDNAVNSYDSRHFGAIAEEDLIGRVYKIYWPLHRAGPIW